MENCKPGNPYLISIIVFSVLAVIFSIMIFIPVFLQSDMMDYGYAISFVSFFLAIAFFITAIIMTGIYRRINKIFERENLLVHWKYEKELWLKFTEKEFTADRKEKRFLFLTILVFIFIISIIFILIDREVWRGFLIVFPILLVILGLLAFLIPKLKNRKSLKILPQVFISLNGVYITGEFHVWDYLTAKLEKACIDNKDMQIKIGYSYVASYQKAYKEVRIPIPDNKLDEASKAIEQLKEKRKIKNKK